MGDERVSSTRVGDGISQGGAETDHHHQHWICASLSLVVSQFFLIKTYRRAVDDISSIQAGDIINSLTKESLKINKYISDFFGGREQVNDVIKS